MAGAYHSRLSYRAITHAKARRGRRFRTLTAAQINEVQDVLDRYVRSQNLNTKKILIVHQFGDPTVHDGVATGQKTLKNYENLELVINADGLGNPASKVQKCNLMTDSTVYPFIQFRGIKVFFPNRWEKRGHFDKPPLTREQSGPALLRDADESLNRISGAEPKGRNGQGWLLSSELSPGSA